MGLRFLVIVLAGCVGARAEPTTAMYTYNSSDLSYLSNGIQFPAAFHGDAQDSGENGEAPSRRLSEMQWFRGLYDHLEWIGRLELLNNTQCRLEMRMYIQELYNGTTWAIKMYDSSGRYNGQFLFGNDYWLGSKSLCQELQNVEKNVEVPPFKVHFFVAKVRININRKLTPVTRQLNIGECLPKSCEVEDIRYMFVREPNQKGSTVKVVGIRPVPGDYKLSEDLKFYSIGGVGLATVLLIVLASLVEILVKGKKNKISYSSDEVENNNNISREATDAKDNKQLKEPKRKKKNICQELVFAFSAINNGKKILSVDNAANESIRCIHGLRFFSIAWIILVHTYLEVFSIADNKNIRILVERTFLYQTISNATFSVDTFFFISGLLVTLTFFRSDAKLQKSSENKKKKTFQSDALKFLLMLVYRFFRLTPAYMFVLGVNEISLRYLHAHSVFSPAIIDHISCSNFWWRNMLYINNFFPQHEFCMLWSWYIANDTQFFVLASLLLLIAVRGNKQLKFVAVSIGVLLIASWITTFVIAMKYDYVARVEEPFALFDQLYDKPWMRIGPYLIGMFVGYWLFQLDYEVKLHPLAVVFGWVASIACLGVLVFGLGTEGLMVPASAFYAALGHTGWGLSLAWITIACFTGYGGPLNALFSSKLFLPLSRLTYCAYLVHPVLMCLTSFVLDGSLHLHTVFVIVIFFGNCVLSFLCAFLISLAFEAPAVNLLKLIL